jgi:hypothetical protein
MGVAATSRPSLDVSADLRRGRRTRRPANRPAGSRAAVSLSEPAGGIRSAVASSHLGGREPTCGRDAESGEVHPADETASTSARHDNSTGQAEPIDRLERRDRADSTRPSSTGEPGREGRLGSARLGRRTSASRVCNGSDPAAAPSRSSPADQVRRVRPVVEAYGPVNRRGRGGRDRRAGICPVRRNGRHRPTTGRHRPPQERRPPGPGPNRYALRIRDVISARFIQVAVWEAGQRPSCLGAFRERGVGAR